MNNNTTATYSYRQIWKVAYPILISLVMEQMIGMTDAAFLGRVGEVELGASAIAGVYYMVIFMTGFGFSIGSQIIIARRNGEGAYRETGNIFYHGASFLLGLAVLLSLISFSLINNTIRLTIYSKRFLIHTMKLVGASWGFIRKPFITRNLWIGILSGAVANAVLTALAYTAVKYEPELLVIISPESIMIVAASVMIFGIIITTLCAYISINKYLRMKISELY